MKKFTDLKDTFCDGVLIGQIGVDKYDRFVGIDTDGKLLDCGNNRPTVYGVLMRAAYRKGLLIRPRQGVYKSANKEAQ